MICINEIPWTFKTWLKNFENVDLPIGDLAKDILSDSNFPQEESYEVIHDYLIRKNADSVILETFLTVWNFYTSSR